MFAVMIAAAAILIVAPNVFTNHVAHWLLDQHDDAKK